MKTSYWLCLSAALAASAIFACSSKFTSCDETFTCAPDSRGGQGGGGSGGTGGEAGASDAGTAGAILFGACTTLGELACQGPAQAQRLACDGAKWQAGTTCAAGQLCDSRSGDCAAVVTECVGATPGQVVCRAPDVPLTCGPDLVTASEGTACDGLCADGVCQPAECGDGKLEANEECEDSNTAGGDGCSAKCGWEPVEIAAQAQVCARSSQGVVKCWGYNADGELGIGHTDSIGNDPGEMGGALAAVSLGTGRYAKTVVTAGNFTCAILDDASVKCWGKNDMGELGLGTTNPAVGDDPNEMGDALPAVALGAGRTAKAIVAGSAHACALLDDGAIKCWGSSEKGQLGNGSVAPVGLAGSDMGDNLKPVDLGAGRTAKAVAAGQAHTCALLDDDTLKCWGDNTYGQLGLGDTNNRGDEPGEMGQALPAINLGPVRHARAIFGGAVAFNTCALLDDGTATCWGSGYSDALGNGSAQAIGDDPTEVGHFPIIDPGGGRSVKSLDFGGGHACALLDDGNVKCWGFNAYGQLGIGDPSSHTSETVAMLPMLDLGMGRTAKQIATGFTHTCALLDDGTVKCWGSNFEGELGQGDNFNRGDGPNQMGDHLPPVDLSF